MASAVNVLVGAASMWTAPAGTPMVPDAQAPGVAWPAPWVNPGFTEQGLTLNVNPNLQDINVEEQSTPVAVLVASKLVEIDVAFSEDTIENMKLSYGSGLIATVAAAVGITGKKTLSLSDTLDRLAVGFEGLNSFGFWRRAYFPTVLSVGSVQTVYRRAANNRSYPAKFRVISDPSQIQIVDKTANAL